MSDLSNYLENAVINFWLRANPGGSLTAPATVYVALFTAVTDAEAGTGTEVTGGSYARQAAAFDAPSNGVTANTSLITFPTASADWGTITHAALFDASTSGNALTIIKALNTSKIIGTGDILRFPAGDIDFSIA